MSGAAAESTQNASESTPANAEAGTQEAPGGELRSELIAKLKENRAARETGDGETTATDGKPPKDGKSRPKRGESTPDKGDAPEGDAEGEEDPALKGERRKFAKHKRKWEAQASEREAAIRQFEQRAQAETQAFEKDPISWLKSRKVDVRATLLRMANEDAEDPRDKKLRELEEEQKREKAERERESAERAEREAQAQQAQAIHQIEKELSSAWAKAEVDDYPTVHAALDPEHVAQRATEIILDHFRRTRKELAPEDAFAIMEKELAPLKGKLANGKKKPDAPGAGPAGKRKTREPSNPEATNDRRPSEDVTRRITREGSVGRPLNFDREGLRERLIDKARGAMR